MNKNYYVAGTFYDVENQREKGVISSKNPGTIESEILENDFVEIKVHEATQEQDIPQLRPNQVKEMDEKGKIREYITGIPRQQNVKEKPIYQDVGARD